MTLAPRFPSFAKSSCIPLLVWRRKLKRLRPLLGTCRLRQPLCPRAYTRLRHRCLPLPRVFPSIPLRCLTMPARTVSSYLMVCYPPFKGWLHSHLAIAPHMFLVHNKWVALPRTFAPLTLPHQDQCSHLLYNLRGLSPFSGETSPPIDHHMGLTTPARPDAHDNGSGERPNGGPIKSPALATKNAWPALAGLACLILPDLRPPITMVV